MQYGTMFSLLNTDHVLLNKSWNYKNVVSPFYRLYLIEDGSGILSNADDNIIMQKGYLYLVPSFTLVNQQCFATLNQYYVHFIEESQYGASLFAYNRRLMQACALPADIEVFKQLVRINPGRDLRKSDNPEVYEKQPILKSFKELNEKQPLAIRMETEGIIMQLLSRFISNNEQAVQQRKNIPSTILGIIDYIQVNLSKPLTVKKLAALANQSPDHFSNLFLQHTGRRPLEYLQYLRVERAQFLMLTTNLSFNAIIADTGFESLSYFNRVFKKITGLTPGGYKASHNHLR